MKEKVAIVTGSSRGIGKAIAVELAQEGFRVVINYSNNQLAAEEVLEEVKSTGSSGMIIGADVSVSESAQDLIDKTIKEYGQVDVLVNNAGINKDQLMMRMKDDAWNRVISTNLNSAFYCSRAALKHMVRKRYGRIINISSVVGLNGNAGQAHYAASKSGLLGLTFSIAREYGSRGITANAIAPGYIQSDMTGGFNTEQSSKLLSAIAVGRLGNPEDIAGVVAFLASPRAAYITAQCIRVDGGLSSL